MAIRKTGAPALGLVSLLALSCNKAPEVKEKPTLQVGSLVCFDSATTAAPDGYFIPEQCPLLVVGVDSAQGLVRVLSSASKAFYFPMRPLVILGNSPVAGLYQGATDSLIGRMAPTPNPGVSQPEYSYALTRNAGPEADTVFPENWPAFGGPLVEHGDLEECLEELRTGPTYGLLLGAFKPERLCRAGKSQAWSYDTGTISRAASSPAPLQLIAMAKPNPYEVPADGWIWAWAKDSTSSFWMWGAKGGSPNLLRAPFMENASVDEVVPMDMDGDGHSELFITTTTYYGDGSYKTLYMLDGRPDASAPRFRSMGISGSSGEPGGSHVAGIWWLAPPYVFSAYASEGNEGAPVNSHDIRLEVFRYDANNGWVRSKDVFHAAFFGRSGLQWEALVMTKLVMDDRKSTLPLRILPRLTKKGIQWQAGAITPNADTAKAWARWDKTGVVRKITADQD